MTARRPGFSLVEVTFVVLFLGILARIAVPSYLDLVYRARAAAALGDLNAVRHAAFEYNVETNRWPADVYPGIVPPELESYLGEGFTFQREHYQLDWENWLLPDGTPKHDNDVLLGVSIVTEDAKLGEALETVVGYDRARYTLGDNYTFIIATH